LSRQRPLGAEIWSSEKVDFSVSEGARSTVLLMDQTKVRQTFLAERGRNRSRSHVCPILDISIRSRDIRDRTLKWSENGEIDPNFARFGSQLFWVRAPKVLGHGLSNTRTFRSYGKVSRRSADRRSRVEKKNKNKEKHQQ